ncbi:MAG: DNA polymerase III subunit delta [Phycisphaerae bacterium]
MAKSASQTTPGGGVAPIMVLAGDELFLRNEHLARIRREVLGEGDPGMALVRLEATASMADVLDECRTPSMFAPAKLVVVDPADGLLKASEGGTMGGAGGGKGRRPASSPRELLEDYLDAQLKSGEKPAGILVLVCESWLKTTRLHKALDKLGAVHLCDPIKPFQVPAWLARRTRDAYEKTLEPRAAARLAELIGPDLQRLDNELAKLALFKPAAPTIGVEAVDALVGFQHEQKIWDMIGALAARDAGVALHKIAEIWQLDPKVDYTAVGAVTFWLNQVLRAREMLDQRMSEPLIAKELRLWPEDRARQTLALAKHWGRSGAAKWSRELLDVDVANKTSVGEIRSNLEKFIVQLCGA